MTCSFFPRIIIRLPCRRESRRKSGGIGGSAGGRRMMVRGGKVDGHGDGGSNVLMMVDEGRDE